MALGTVLWFRQEEAYGLVRLDTGAEVLVETAALTSEGVATLRAGDEVALEVVQAPLGLKAIQISLMRRAGQPP